MSVRVAEALIVVVPTEPDRGVLTAVRWVAGFDEVVVGAGGSVVDDPVGAVLGNVGLLGLVVGALDDVVADLPPPHDASVKATRPRPTMACPNRLTESPWPGLSERPRAIGHN